MIHPDTELRFINPKIGHGVFATRRIPRGTITWVRDPLDRAFSPQQVRDLGPLYARTLLTYSFMDGRGDYVLCWDHARYVNHSCEAPCLTAGGFEFELAVRDIEAGEELTDDYGTLNLQEEMACACGSSLCRGGVGPGDAARLADHWDEQIRAAFPWIGKVVQPLMPLVAEKGALERTLSNLSLLASCREQLRPTLGRGERNARMASGAP